MSDQDLIVLSEMLLSDDANNVGGKIELNLQCECNDKCGQYGNCCPDYDEECGGGGGGSLSDQDLIVLSEMLLSDDANNVGGKIALNLQCTTHNGNPLVISPHLHL